MATKNDGAGIKALVTAGAFKVELFEISKYAPAIEYAKRLGLTAIRMRLLLTIDEERSRRSSLTFC